VVPFLDLGKKRRRIKGRGMYAMERIILGWYRHLFSRRVLGGGGEESF